MKNIYILFLLSLLLISACQTQEDVLLIDKHSEEEDEDCFVFE